MGDWFSKFLSKNNMNVRVFSTTKYASEKHLFWTWVLKTNPIQSNEFV